MTDPLDTLVMTLAAAGLIVIAWLLGAFSWLSDMTDPYRKDRKLSGANGRLLKHLRAIQVADLVPPWGS